MRAFEAEVQAAIRKVQADLSPMLPPELAMTAQDMAAVRIRLQVLRARLEFPPEQEEMSLPLTSLLALLTELVGHAAEIELAPDKRAALLATLRGTILTGDAAALRAMLERQRQSSVR